MLPHHQLIHCHHRSLSILLNSLVRLKLQLTPACKQQLLTAVAAHIQPHQSRQSTSSSQQPQQFSGRDLCMLVWALPCLHITPSPALLTAVLQSTRRHIPSLDWPHLTALLVGIGRLRFVPPGPLVLELYDQLYWTVDQLNLGQLAAVVWALGRLRVVAVPPDMMERLLVFVGVQLQQELKQQQRQLGKQLQDEEEVTAPSGSAAAAAAAPNNKQAASASTAVALARQRFTLAKHLSLLLSGLRGLRRQLNPQQQQQHRQHCREWLLTVLDVATPQAAKQVAGSILAAAQLQVTLSLPAERSKLFGAVSAVAGCLQGSCLAQAVWGAVVVGGPPPQQQLQEWLLTSLPSVPNANAGVLHMLLHACVRGGQLPSAEWWGAAAEQLQQLVPRMSGSNCVFLSQLLLDLLRLQQHQGEDEQQGEEQAGSGVGGAALSCGTASTPSPPVAAAAAGPLTAGSVRQLLGLLSSRVEQLEVQQQHMSSSALHNFEGNRQQLMALLLQMPQ